MKKNNKLQAIIEVAIFAAIAVALDLIQGGLFKGVFASGGSIGFAMLPIFIISYRRGLGYGILCGFIVSVLQMLSGIYVIQGATMPNDFLKACGPFIQVMLDYVLAYTLVGFAGLFAKVYKKSGDQKSRILFIILGCLVGGMLKYLVHTIAGIVFWLGDGSGSFAGIANNTHLYSWIYNGAYCIPNIIICTIIMVIIAIRYPFFLDLSNEELLNENMEDNAND